MYKIALVFIGGGLGSISRYGVSLLSVKLFGDRFPAGTLSVNLAGCLLIGILFSMGTERNFIGPSARLFLMTGFMGGLTTFSSFGLESVNLARTGLMDLSLINIAANNLGGLAMVLAGIFIGRYL